MPATATEPAAAPTWRVAAVLPYEDPRSAEAGLRAELRHLLAAGPEPDWSTFTVSEPVRSTDARGAVWFYYSATVSALRPGGAPGN